MSLRWPFEIRLRWTMHMPLCKFLSRLGVQCWPESRFDRDQEDESTISGSKMTKEKKHQASTKARRMSAAWASTYELLRPRLRRYHVHNGGKTTAQWRQYSQWLACLPACNVWCHPRRPAARQSPKQSKASEQAELRYLRPSQFLTGTELFLSALSKARGSRSELWWG